MRGVRTCGGADWRSIAGFQGDLRTGISDAGQSARVVIGPVTVLEDYACERPLAGLAALRVRSLGDHNRGCRRSQTRGCVRKRRLANVAALGYMDNWKRGNSIAQHSRIKARRTRINL